MVSYVDAHRDWFEVESICRVLPKAPSTYHRHRQHQAAESVIGLLKTEVIRRKGPWRSLEAVEFATLAWVDWFNLRRLLGTDRRHPGPSSKRSTMRRLGA